MKSNPIFISLLLIITQPVLFAGEFDGILLKNNFEEQSIPIYGTVEWENANRNKTTYFVEIINGQISIKTEGNSYRENLTYDADSVKYLGTNHGEWGGKLIAKYSNDTEIELIRENIVALIPYRPKHLRITEDDEYYEDGKPGLYVFTGLAHLGSSRGAIYVVENYKKSPEIRKLTLLPDAPYVIVNDTNNNDSKYFTIIGSSTVMSYDPNWDDFEVELFDQFWWGMYPTSAIKVNSEVLIGMRGGVVVIDMTHGLRNVRFFKKKESNKQLHEDRAKSARPVN